MFSSLHMREAQSKQINQRYDDVPNYEIGDLVILNTSTKSLQGIQSTYLTLELCT